MPQCCCAQARPTLPLTPNRPPAVLVNASEHVIAIYQSDLAFLHLLKHADLNREVIDKLECAVKIGLVRLELKQAARKLSSAGGCDSLRRL